MSLRQIVSPLCLIGALGLTSAASAQVAPVSSVVDAAGRVFGSAVPMPAQAVPTASAPAVATPTPPATPPKAAIRSIPAPMVQPAVAPGWDDAAWQRAQADWLDECRRRYPAGKKGTTLGAVLGGLFGGVLGNRVAGRGDRVLGTVAGAVVGGVAGGAIGSSADRSRARDYCESYLEDYLARQQRSYGYGQPGVTYGYAMQPMVMMVPVMTVQPQPALQQQPDCREVVETSEWVPVTTRSRIIPRRVPARPMRRTVPDKRVRID